LRLEVAYLRAALASLQGASKQPPDLYFVGLQGAGDWFGLLLLALMPGGGLADVSLANLAESPKLEELHLVCVGLNAGLFAGMSRLPRFKALRIAGNLLGGAELAELGTISSLERLQFGGYKITVDGWRQLRRLRQLKHLLLSGIDDLGAAALDELASLETLAISSTRLQASQLQPWASLRHLRHGRMGTDVCFSVLLEMLFSPRDDRPSLIASMARGGRRIMILPG
jgi:hypothetical protein